MKLLLSLLILTAFCFAQENVRYINVVGKAEMNIQADMIESRFQIRIVKPTLEESKNANQNTTKELHKVLKELGIEKNDIEITPLRFGKHYEYEDNKRVFKGYFSQNTVNVTFRDVPNYYGLIDKVSKIKFLETSDSRFGLSKLTKYNHEINEKALLAAKKKAENIARVMEVKLGKILEIDEGGNSGSSYGHRAANYSEMAVKDMGGAAGKVKVSKSIRVKYKIVD